MPGVQDRVVVVTGAGGGLGREYALTLARDVKKDEALAALGALEKDGFGSYPVLARMRRGYTVADYHAIVDRLRAAVPHIA